MGFLSLINGGYYPLTNWDDPPSTLPLIIMVHWKMARTCKGNESWTSTHSPLNHDFRDFKILITQRSMYDLE